ncbi:MAG: acetyl-CoA C-acyltransferase [Bdellovibrionales bacterium]|nr:acetyl-CoA C-acyltransferase [Bdellovibrionales bacterium]
MSNSDRIVVVSGARTPFARARTVFGKMSPAALGGITLRETVARAGIDPKLIDEIYYGIVSAPAEGSNVSREALFDSGLPAAIPCTTINRYCASSAEAVAGIAAKITAGQIEIGIAGGVESISSIRALFSNEATNFFSDIAKMKTTGQKLAHLAKFKPAYLAPMAPGIVEPTTGKSMGQSADLMARQFGVGRAEQDAYAVESHKKAAKGWETGFFKELVVGVPTKDGTLVERDTDIRADTSVEKLAGLRPVFYKDGTITAGNASPLTDGASAVLLMKESKAKELGLKPIAAIRSIAAAGVDIQKEPLLIGPVKAIPHALKMAGISWNDLDLIEIHEAFAGQVLATFRAIESDAYAKEKLGLGAKIGTIDTSKVNPHGGSIPLGHPFGATGTRLVMQTALELQKLNKKLALISICAAGGLGEVLVMEAI